MHEHDKRQREDRVHTNDLSVAPPVGTRVRLDFEGVVTEWAGANPNIKLPYYTVPVSDGARIHHLNWESDVFEIAPAPRPAMELGQVWYADGRNFVVSAEYLKNDRFIVRAAPAADGRTAYSSDEFFAKYSDAHLVLNADGNFHLSDGDF